MPSFPYLTRDPRTTSTYPAHTMRQKLFGHDAYAGKIPADVEIDWDIIDGVRVCCMTSADARRFWKNPNTRTPMRIIARCPECFKIVPASRINQHARVHQGKK